jgi:hypothetical protein
MIHTTTLFPKALYLPPIVAQTTILQIFVPTSVPTTFNLAILDLTVHPLTTPVLPVSRSEVRQMSLKQMSRGQ